MRFSPSRRSAVGLLADCGCDLRLHQPTPSEPAAKSAAAPTQTPAERGKVLVQVGGCHDCHTTKKDNEPDMSVMLSGHPSSHQGPGSAQGRSGKPVDHPDDRYPDGVERTMGHQLCREPHAGPRHGLEKQRMV